MAVIYEKVLRHDHVLVILGDYLEWVPAQILVLMNLPFSWPIKPINMLTTTRSTTLTSIFVSSAALSTQTYYKHITDLVLFNTQTIMLTTILTY